MRKRICLLMALLLLLAGCASGSGFDPEMARNALQAHLSEQSGASAELEGFEVLSSVLEGNTAEVTCTAVLEGETATYRIVYEKSGGKWVLRACNRMAELPAATAPVEESTEGMDASCLLIPEDALRWNGHSYYVYDDNTIRTWEAAQLFCESLGGYLAVIASEEENAALYEYVKSCGYTQVFFGLSDAGHEGKWKWVPQEESNYRNWHAGQPNGGERDNYVQFVDNYVDGSNSHTGEWSDSIYGASHIYVFLCEWPSE